MIASFHCCYCCCCYCARIYHSSQGDTPHHYRHCCDFRYSYSSINSSSFDELRFWFSLVQLIQILVSTALFPRSAYLYSHTFSAVSFMIITLWVCVSTLSCRYFLSILFFNNNYSNNSSRTRTMMMMIRLRTAKFTWRSTMIRGRSCCCGCCYCCWKKESKGNNDRREWRHTLLKLWS